MDNEDLVEEFLRESADTVDVFSDLQEVVRESESPEGVLDDIFRRVHSLKGTSSCLTEYDGRMVLLSSWCHRFETFLDSVRKGEVAFTLVVRELVGDCLDALATDIELLQDGDSIADHTDLLSSMELGGAVTTASRSAVSLSVLEQYDSLTVLRSGNLLVFQLRCSIDSGRISDELNKLMWQHTEAVGPNVIFVLDFGDKYLLPSMAIGGIIGMINRTARIYMVAPPIFLRSLFRRFNLECAGFAIVDSLNECKE